MLCLPGNFLAEERGTTVVLSLGHELVYRKPKDQSGPVKRIRVSISRRGEEGRRGPLSVAFPSFMLLGGSCRLPQATAVHRDGG